MSGSAITLMIISMVLLWGGMALSIWNAVKATKKKNKAI
ncbi:MetS family NSS transporter small subunit [Alkalihalobacillus pseudalcaliphilus]|nr:MetS family NSS transporter small subunit [Alkalihalobacillus pseudalcaliphilus]